MGWYTVIQNDQPKNNEIIYALTGLEENPQNEKTQEEPFKPGWFTIF